VFWFYSYVEIETKQQNAISHRGRALEVLRAYLQQAPGPGGGVGLGVAQVKHKARGTPITKPGVTKGEKNIPEL